MIFAYSPHYSISKQGMICFSIDLQQKLNKSMFLNGFGGKSFDCGGKSLCLHYVKYTVNG